MTLQEKIAEGLKLLASLDAEAETVGRHEVNDFMYYNVSEYTTNPIEKLGKAEAHREYVDIQYMVRGEERIDSAEQSTLERLTDYEAGSDCEFFRAVPNMSSVILRPGSAAIYYPSNAHMPGIAVDQPSAVKKIVVKVKI